MKRHDPVRTDEEACCSCCGRDVSAELLAEIAKSDTGATCPYCGELLRATALRSVH